MKPTAKTTIVPKPREKKVAREAELDLNLEQEPASSHFGARLRGYFLTGLIVVGPVAITIYVVWWFINLVDAWVKPLLPQDYLPDTYLPFKLPGVGLIVGIFALMVVGSLTANLFGRTIVSYGFALGDEVDCDLRAESGGRVEVRVKELPKIGFCKELDFFGIIASCEGLLGLSRCV